MTSDAQVDEIMVSCIAHQICDGEVIVQGLPGGGESLFFHRRVIAPEGAYELLSLRGCGGQEKVRPVPLADVGNELIERVETCELPQKSLV